MAPSEGSDKRPALNPASDHALRSWRAAVTDAFLEQDDNGHITKYFEVPAKFATTSDGRVLRCIRQTLPALTASAIARAV
jgi:hypothetical protein